ncbi:O-antigen ligase family protein [Sphingomonas sp. LR60]|uniref:O-antigen ligase family protein n=1 Tax=Sphingomonas sp. LR60 TaxID=3050233 RepID=UPI002FDFB907
MGLCPLFATYARQPRYQPAIMFALGALPFLLAPLHLYVAPVSFPYWPGHTKGIEVSIVDALAIAVLVATPRRKKRVPWIWLFIAYIAIVAVSASWAIDKLAALGFAAQLVRMLILLLAARRLSSNPNAFKAIVAGGVVALCIQLAFALQQHFSGVLQASGTMGAQNLLGLVTNLVGIPALSLALAKTRGWYAKLGPVMALAIDVLTASRATLAFGAAGMGALLVISSIWRWTPQKRQIFALATLAAVVVTPIGIATISKRAHSNNVESSNAERAAFKQAAWMMIKDYPAGVGANCYVVISNIGNYATRAGVNATSGSRSTNVHDSYLLVTAETGMVSAILLVLFIGSGIVKILRTAFRNRKDKRGEYLLGIGMSLLMVGLHLKYEWAFVMYPVQHLIFVFLGLGIGLAEEVTADAAAERRAKRLAQKQAKAAAGDDEPMAGVRE